MKIGYDAKRAFLNFTGLGNYSRWLVSTLAQQYPENEYYLYTPKAKNSDRLGFLSVFTQIHAVAPRRNLFTAVWRTTGIIKNLKKDGIGVFHGLSHELPYGIPKSGIKTVVTMHDVISIRYPEYFDRISRAIYRVKLKYACRVADRIVSVSQHTKDDIVALLGTDPQKITVVYPNCHPSFLRVCSTEEKQAVLKKYKLPPEYILSVGTVEERKNQWVLINALTFYSDMKLVIVGKQTAYAAGIKKRMSKFQLNNQVMFVDNVHFDDLPAIYQAAKLFVYPSRYEGFGLPILEALKSGTAVIAAKGSCLEEAGGPDTLYFEPDDHIELAEKIHLVMNDPALRKNMIAKGTEYSLNFNDDKLAAEMMAVYNQVLNHA